MRDPQSVGQTYDEMQAILFGAALGATLAPPGETAPEFSDEALLRLLTLGSLHRDAASLRAALEPAPSAARSAAAFAVQLALNGVPVTAYLPQIMAFTDGLSAEFDAALYRIGHAGAWTSEAAALEHIGQARTPEQSVALALYCVIRCPDDLVACVRQAGHVGGDSVAIAGIVGGIMGARLGLEAIPMRWWAHYDGREGLIELARQLAQSAGGKEDAN